MYVAHSARKVRSIAPTIAALIMCILSCLGSQLQAISQQTVNLASAGGRVVDTTGAIIAGASVTARQTETNLSNTTVTDQEGRFRFPYLSPGPYQFTVREAGFGDAVRSIRLAVGGAVDLSITLGLATVETSVDVNGEQEVLE